MQTKFLRLMGIIRLLETRGPVSIRTICRFVRANERSVYRDLSDLRSVDIPIENDGHLYSLSPDWQENWTVYTVRKHLERT
jgi:predicted DNA-binding transcriptional regulator YafY